VGLKKARFVVTSRWTGYRKVDGIDFEFEHLRADVRDFSAEQQKEFLEKWFVAAYLRDPRDQDAKVSEEQWRAGQRQRGLDKAKNIVDFLADDDNKAVRELAVVPMLLQVMAILWRDRENLPQGRAELYQAAIKYLLDYRDRRRNIKPVLKANQSLRVLCPISFWMQDELHCDEVSRSAMHGQIQPILDTIDDDIKAEGFCENLRDRAGLIADYGDDDYVFRHKSFREYLAGLELVTRAGRDPECLERITGQFGEDWWAEPLRFFMGEVDDTLFDQFMDVLFKSGTSKELDQKSYDRLLSMVSEAPQKRIDSLVKRLNDADSTDNQRRYIVDCLKTIGSKAAMEAIEKFGKKKQAGAAAAYAQDITVEVSDEISVTDVPKAEIVEKAAESFRNRYEYNADYILIQGGRYKYQGKLKQVPATCFAKYPVTNKRYRRFIRYLQDNEPNLTAILPKTQFDSRMNEVIFQIEGLSDYVGHSPKAWPEKLRSTYDTEKRFSGEDQPVIGVSWFAARAYCCWLSLLEGRDWDLSPEKLANMYRLPTEIEWEWAAGGGKREYPWSSEKGGPSDKLANYDEHVGATTPVGRYPEGATPEGLMGMAGNVWEWMENWHEKYKGKYRSLRGGSWSITVSSLRCSSRNYYAPVGRYYNVGFRVVRSQS
jgi:formylglycine-generating enzyme required for sulfatase activity